MWILYLDSDPHILHVCHIVSRYADEFVTPNLVDDFYHGNGRVWFVATVAIDLQKIGVGAVTT